MTDSRFNHFGGGGSALGPQFQPGGVDRSYQAHSADLDVQSSARKAAKLTAKNDARTAAGKEPKVAKVKYAPYNPPKIRA